MNNFGLLKWIVEELSDEVNFLDLTITIDPSRKIVTKTFVKPLNLHLYIPPSSAHPPGMLRGLIFGTLRRYWMQNSRVADYQTITTRFAENLMARGYTRDTIEPIFIEASARFDIEASQPVAVDKAEDKAKGALFYHVEFHPRDVGRRTIRQAFDRYLKPVTDFNRFIVAYHRPKNLGDRLSRTKLHEDGDYQISSFRP